MSIKESPDTSCRISAIGNSGARSPGPTGWPVPGCSGGGGGEGRSGITLYHWRGISDSSRVILVRSVTTALPLTWKILSRTLRLMTNAATGVCRTAGTVRHVTAQRLFGQPQLLTVG